MTGFDWEFGDLWVWVADGKRKPFPVSVRKDHDEIVYVAHPPQPLNADQEERLDVLMQGIIKDIRSIWNGHTQTCLSWPELGKRKKKR